MQASISTLIAREYYHPEGRWGTNLPLFVRAVGSHPDRLSNLYFTFLFVLRAVAKAGDVLSEYPYHTGDPVDDRNARRMVQRLVRAGLPRLPADATHSEALLGSHLPIARDNGATHGHGHGNGDSNGNTSGSGGTASRGGTDGGRPNSKGKGKGNVLAQCRNGFDESALFQAGGAAPGAPPGGQYWASPASQVTLLT